jgi:hypothetical protein
MIVSALSNFSSSNCRVKAWIATTLKNSIKKTFPGSMTFQHLIVFPFHDFFPEKFYPGKNLYTGIYFYKCTELCQSKNVAALQKEGSGKCKCVYEDVTSS